MKNMNNKTKKWLVVAGGLALSAVLVVLITSQFKTAPITDVDIPDGSSQNQDVQVETPNTTEKENGVDVPAIEISDQDTAAKGDDKGTDQTIQGDVPEQPSYTDDELSNPEQTPDGEKVTPPTQENPNPPQTQNPPTSTPSTGGGLPGFGSVPNGGANQTTDANDMYENGNKVGSMD